MSREAIGLRIIGKDLERRLTGRISISIEMNEKGVIGFIDLLPGAFVRGQRLDESLLKVPAEVMAYFRWIGHKNNQHLPETHVVQSKNGTLDVEEGNTEVLLDEDKRSMSRQELEQLLTLVEYSGNTFNRLYDSTHFKDWKDSARIRKTFYGKNPTTIREIFDHVNGAQQYYLSRVGIPLQIPGESSFMKSRNDGMKELTLLFSENGNSKIYNIDGEDWTLKKVLRRFIWHDRIHGKAITRVLEKQRQLGEINDYENPFQFSLF